MGRLDDVAAAGDVHGPARFIAWATLALILLTVLYALRIVVANWSFIGV